MKNPQRLLNCRNLGVNLRVLIIVNLSLLLAAVFLSTDLNSFFAQLLRLSAIAQPMLLFSLLLLYLSYPAMNKLPHGIGLIAVLGVINLACFSVLALLTPVFSVEAIPSTSRVVFFSSLIGAVTLYYFHLQHRAYSPAIDEARLQVLQARIQPHFLFNCINAVLSLIRSQPKQAETALEDMADLFRVLMADNRDLVTLADEIALCRQYLALEKLRLGDRLKVQWQIDGMPARALIPPLVLQPLLENAVHHGIEPMADGGTIVLKIVSNKNELHLLITNPYQAGLSRHFGNNMALKNIQERLTLHFDLEASLRSRQADGLYQVHIILPHTTA